MEYVHIQLGFGVLFGFRVDIIIGGYEAVSTNRGSFKREC